MKKITFNVDSMLPSIALASGIAQKSSIPILANVFINSYSKDGNKFVIVSASDSEVWLYQKKEIIDGDEMMSTAINAADLLKYLSSLRGKTVSLVLDEEKNIADIEYGNGKFSLPTDAASDFPEPVIDKENTYEKNLPSGTLLRAISLTKICASPDILRPIMNGIHFDFFEDSMVSVALDKSKFAKYTDMSVKSDSEECGGFTMPTKAANIAAQIASDIDGDIKLTFGGRNVVISCSSYKMVATMQEGKYPPYNVILKDEKTVKATLSREDVINALNRVMLSSNLKSNFVRFDFTTDKLTVSTESVEFSKSAKEEIDCTCNSESFSIGFNGKSVISLLENISDDNIVIGMSNQSKPASISPETQEEGEEYVAVAMPMVLNIA